MIRSARFWTFMAVFQVVFGLTVFALTRQYYLDAQQAPTSSQAAAANSSRAAPHPTPSDWPTNSGRSDLANLISSFPAQPLSTDPDVLAAQGDELFSQKQYQGAAHLYEQALAAGARDANTYNSLGLTLHYLGRSAEALQILEDGIAIDPDYQRIWLTLGFVNSQTGNLDAARTALSTAQQMNPDNEIGRSAADMLDNLR